jgi:hypothetical protein
VAAVKLGRKYRGIEQSPEYRRIAEGRIASYKDQPQIDDQDEEEVLQAAAEIRQRRVAAKLKEIQERRQNSRFVRIKKRGGPVLYGDCLDLIPTIGNGSVSSVVTSPPYADQRAGHYQGVSEEDYPDFTVEWMTALAPKMTADGSVFLVIRPHVRGGVLSDYVLRTRLALREVGWHECEELIWLKPDAPPLGSLKRPRRTWERFFGSVGTRSLTAISRHAARNRNGWASRSRFGLELAVTARSILVSQQDAPRELPESLM